MLIDVTLLHIDGSIGLLVNVFETYHFKPLYLVWFYGLRHYSIFIPI